MTKTAVVQNSENSYVVCTLSAEEAKQIIKEKQQDAKSVATTVSATSSRRSGIKSTSSRKKNRISREARDAYSVPGTVSVPSSVQSGNNLRTVWEDESRDGASAARSTNKGDVSIASSVSTSWDRQGERSVWERKYFSEKNINDELRKQLSQRDREIDNLGKTAYKKVEKLRDQRAARDDRVAELERKIAQQEAEIARERASHENTKAALKVQLEDNIIAREEAATLKKKTALLEQRMGAIGKAFGKTENMPKPSISIRRNQSGARAA